MNNNLTRFEALKLAIIRMPAVAGAKPGTQDAAAVHLGVSQATISNWLNQSKQLPAEHVLNAELLTGVSRHDLRPDIYPRLLMVDRGAANRFYGTDRFAGARR